MVQEERISNKNVTRKSKKRRSFAAKNAGGIELSQSRAISIVCFLLAAVTAALYSGLVRHPFLNYQDSTYVFENKHILSGLSWHTIAWAFTSSDAASWQPLSWVSHAVDYQIFGLKAGGHHVVSLLLHLVNLLLLFLLLSRATGQIGRSAFVAALFALHPINVESVAWIAERKNLLSTFFFLLALGAYGWYVRRVGARRYLLLFLLFVLGLMAEPMLVTLPFLLLLLDYWPLRRIQGLTTPSETFPTQLPWQRLVLEKLPLFALSLASSIITLIVHSRAEAIEPLVNLPITWRLENALYSYAMYMAKLFCLASFAVVYPHPRDTITFVQLATAGAFLAAVSYFIWLKRSRYGYLLTGWLWFLGALVPVIGIIQIGGLGMADHYAYIPAIGIFLIVVWGVADLIGSASLQPHLGASLAVAVLGFMTFASYRQIALWNNGFDLWKHTLETTKSNFIAHDEMADLLLRQGLREGLAFFEHAAKLAPWDPVSHSAVAGALHDHGDLHQAIDEYNTALAANPGPKLRAHICFDLDVIYRELGDDTRAEQNLQQAMGLDPQGVEDSIDQLSRLVEARPAAIGYYRLGLLCEAANRLSDAKSDYLRALQLDPKSQLAMRALAILSMSSPPDALTNQP